MKNWTKKCFALLVACTLLLINACTITEPSFHNKTDNAIDEALKDGLRTNNSLKKSHKSTQTIPLALQKALTPEINLPNSNVAIGEKSEQKFDIAVNNVSAKDFFMGLVKDTKYNITVHPEVVGSISLELKSITVPQAMEAVRDNYGFEYERTSYGYKVFPRRLETRVFNINYIDVERTGQSQITIGGSSGQSTSNNGGNSALGNNYAGNTTNNANNQQQGSSQNSNTSSGTVSTSSSSKFWDLLKQNLESIVGTQDGRSVVVNPRSGVVIARAFPNELRYVAQYLDSIQNIIHRQVIIEAKILDVRLTAEFSNGINWKTLGLFQGETGGTSIDNSNTFLGGIVGVSGMNVTDGGAFSSVIRLLNQQGRVNVLSSPRIATINNQKAVIKVGEDSYYVTNVSGNTINSSTGNPTETSNISLTPFFSGISLDVTPQIDENDNVTIHIHPIVSEVTQETKKFTVNQKSQELPLAKSTVKESDSIVRAKNGQVIVIGGLMVSRGENIQASTPGADRLPGISGLFKNSKRTAAKSELVILLRPIIAESASTWQQQLQEAAVNIKRMKDNFSYDVVPARQKH